MLEYFLDDNDTSREAQIIRRAMLGISGRKVVPTTDQQVDGMMATASTQDPPKAPFVSELPPEKPSSAQTDPVYERGLAAQKSLFDFVSKASEESGRDYRGVFGSFRPERAIQDWYENNPELAEDYNKAVISIGTASNQKEVIRKTEDSFEETEFFGQRGSQLLNRTLPGDKDPRLLTPIPKATGGVSQVPTEEPIPQEAPNGPPSGVIGSQNASPEETVADDIPMEVPEGAFIINAAAAEVAGYGDIKKMILDAVGVARRLGVEISTGEDEAGDEEAVDLLVSKGEVYIEPTLAKIIGYDVLEKINNRGKREVARRQQEAEAQQQPPQEQPPQAPPQPQMAQEGGFVKKKFSNGGDVDDLLPSERARKAEGIDPIPTKRDSLKEIDPLSDKAKTQADIEFGFDMINRSNNDPVIRAAFQDSQRRLPSQFIEMRNLGVEEAEKFLEQKVRKDYKSQRSLFERVFNLRPLTPEEFEKRKEKYDYYFSAGDLKEAKSAGVDTLTNPSTEFRGKYSPIYDDVLARNYRKIDNPVDVSANLYHELLHKGHEKLVGIPGGVLADLGEYKKATPQQLDRAGVLHLDVHRRTYEAYKDELSPESIKQFIERTVNMYGSKATRAYIKRFADKLIVSKMPYLFQKSTTIDEKTGKRYRPDKPKDVVLNTFDYELISDDLARPIADAVFAEVAKLPPIRALNEELKTAYQKQQKNSQGFAEGGKTSTEYPDYIKKYFMPEIDYHLETIRTKTVARNQYGQPVTALTSGVLRDGKIYEIPTYDRKGGILSRKQVESSLDSYIEKYGDFGIPQDQYRSLMKEKEAYKQNLYKKDSRFQVTDDSITQTVTLPEKGQKNSQGFIPKK